MQSWELQPHPAAPPSTVRGVSASVLAPVDGWLRLRWRVEGANGLLVPPFAGNGRADGLWRTTCFELFVQPVGGEAYTEFNFSPSDRWAAYDFTARREGLAERVLHRAPVCTLRRGGDRAIFDVALPMAALPAGECAAGLTAVIEETGGVKSWWALAHGGTAPDFHDPACFTASLAAPTAP
ncbi:DOMON-like domain-containing protein [Croceibacterium ferulae]|uniref:DOMON-like domain-containing protein n=1 Tax=Croceibacterium ferulae TaxID=1854641 RepID=UPI000EAE36CD|nr:DOMON-like domain-containing protein [Croceibacterium ferulae]